MNNLKPNMYIRTKEGKIDKVLEINTEDFDEPVVRLASFPLGMYQGMFEYKKASHNIIDLIEAGDYVNGEKVGEVIRKNMYHFGDGIIIKNETGEDIYSNFRYSKYANVETIVTKEQFESMSYKVGE